MTIHADLIKCVRGISHRRNPLGEIDQPDLSALAALLDPISKTDFINVHWERSPLLVNRDPPEWLGRLLAVSDVDSLISLTNNVGSEDVRVAKSRDETVEHLPIARGSPGSSPGNTSSREPGPYPRPWWRPTPNPPKDGV